MINDALLYFTKKGGEKLTLDAGGDVCSKTVDLAATGAVDEELFLSVGYKETAIPTDVVVSVILHEVNTHTVFMTVDLDFTDKVPFVQQVRIPRHSPPFTGVLNCRVTDVVGTGENTHEILEIFLTNSQQKKLLKIV